MHPGLENRPQLGAGRWLLLGCRVTASKWKTLEAATIAAEWKTLEAATIAADHLDKEGCGVHPCQGDHEIVDLGPRKEGKRR